MIFAVVALSVICITLLILIVFLCLNLRKRIDNQYNQCDMEFKTQDSFGRKRLLSDYEKCFYQKVLLKLLDNKELSIVIVPKASLNEIVEIRDKNFKDKICAEYKEAKRLLSNFRHVDFLICSKSNLFPYLAIELDDSTHILQVNEKNDEIKSSILKSAHIKLLRVKDFSPSESKEVLDERVKNISSVIKTAKEEWTKNKKSSTLHVRNTQNA